ncbi:MAG: chemotaxis protein CheW [Candidatus Bathyarchaeota archaeon]|nr:chemotaxis protein CheW [Candidatus Bathyarchaeota archaeon]
MTTSGDVQIVNFTVGNVNYGVPVEQVREVRDVQVVTPVPGAPSYVEGVTNLRGQIITVMDLRKRLNIIKDGASEKIIVIELGKAAVGVVVDSVTEVSTIADADIDRNVQATKCLDNYVVGVGKQGDKLIVILDLTKIISDVREDLPEPDHVTIKKQVAVEKIAVA